MLNKNEQGRSFFEESTFTILLIKIIKLKILYSNPSLWMSYNSWTKYFRFIFSELCLQISFLTSFDATELPAFPFFYRLKSWWIITHVKMSTNLKKLDQTRSRIPIVGLKALFIFLFATRRFFMIGGYNL